MKKFGLVTIGQAPRIDLTPEIKAILGQGYEIFEKGALDGLTLEEVKSFYPLESDEALVTRMADGTEVKVAERYVFPRLKNKIKEFEDEGIKVIFIACTGEFPAIKSNVLIVRPQRVVYNVIHSIAQELTLGVLIPDDLQVNSAQVRWAGAAARVIVEAGSPYGKIENIGIAAEKLRQSGADIVIMDCMGYTLKMKDIVYSIVNKPVVLSRSITAKVLSELL